MDQSWMQSVGLTSLPAGTGGEWVSGEGRGLTCSCKLGTPLSFHPCLEEMEKPRKVLTSRIRGEPACPQ